jgi:ATP-dependent protease HslVU (ClpYQ) peptidase subunit
MTTVAYRDGILVADSQLTIGSMRVPGTVSKIGKTKAGILYGGAGSLADLGNFFDWVQDPDDEAPDGEYHGLIILPTGKVIEVEGGAILPTIQQPFRAIGSGAPYAIAAMLAGATAQEAVRIGIKLDIHSSGPIRTMKL